MTVSAAALKGAKAISPLRNRSVVQVQLQLRELWRLTYTFTKFPTSTDDLKSKGLPWTAKVEAYTFWMAGGSPETGPMFHYIVEKSASGPIRVTAEGRMDEYGKLGKELAKKLMRLAIKTCVNTVLSDRGVAKRRTPMTNPRKRKNPLMMMDLRDAGMRGQRYAVKANPRKRNPLSPGDQTTADELKLCMENEGSLYNQRKSIEKNLITKMARGTYDRDKAVKLWMYWVEAGAKWYYKENYASAPANSYRYVFPKHLRLAVAKEFAAEFEQEAKHGSFDSYLPKKYAKKNPLKMLDLRNAGLRGQRYAVAANPREHSGCGGRILIGGRGNEKHEYCDHCGAFKYVDVKGRFPSGSNREANKEAYDSGLMSSLEQGAVRKRNPLKRAVKSNPSYWNFQLFSRSGKLIGTEKGRGSKTEATTHARKLVGQSKVGHRVHKVVLVGPVHS